ncbi:hypothetical protein HPB50_025849 [Hyalomma asiaticum]|uniref:Uncharacterized protein n=1 Tax=Hyalomma asiaticum TaxID=266040 RepID=A0ACB7TND0_HYAAI|nr:hypothetical protein HPB50_025849 [Hyalomma asiaticum]
MVVDECAKVGTLETAPWLGVVRNSPTFESWNVKASTTQVIFLKLKESGGVVQIEKAMLIQQDGSDYQIHKEPSYVPQIGEHNINFDHYRKLQEVDGKHQLRVVPKLTKEHVSPDDLRKMNVRLAVQLFSRSTAIGLKVYQWLKEPDLQDCQGTAEFTLMVNLFDALNVKLPRFGIKSSSRQVEVIQQLLDAVNKTEKNHIAKGTVMFASQVTVESLRVTFASVRDLVGDLCKGARYVLTCKLNQDPLEIFFGMTTSYGGDEDHPTIISFVHIYRLLSLYTPISTCVTGNVSEEQTFELATVADSMKRGRKDTLSSHGKLQEAVGAKLAEICSIAENGTSTAPDHGYPYQLLRTVLFTTCAGTLSALMSSM